MIVNFSTRLDAKRAIIEIADDGPGFDAGIIDQGFERFRRGDRSGPVGLAESKAGQGAIVTILLPYKSSLS